MSNDLISPNCQIHPSVKIGSNVRVGPWCVIGENVTIGSDSVLDSHIVIKKNTKIGEGNRIFQFSSIGEDPADKKFSGEETWLEIGDQNIFREGVTAHRGTRSGGGITKIGSNNLLMPYVHIAHDCFIGNHILMANGAQLAGHVLIEDHATLGGFSLIHQFVRIGRNSFTSMGSAVNLDLPPYCLASGNYARAIGLNRVGLRRFGMESKVLDALSRAFRMLVQRRLEL